MKIKKFVQKLAEGVKKELGEHYCMETKEVLENNRIIQNGIQIRTKGEDAMLCIYVDELYQRFSADGITIEQAVEEIVRTYHEDDENLGE